MNKRFGSPWHPSRLCSVVSLWVLIAPSVLAPPAWGAGDRPANPGPGHPFRAGLLETMEGQSLWEFHGLNPVAPASLTKLMTAYVLFQALRAGRITWEQKLRVPPEAAASEGSRAGLKAGQQLSVGQLVEAMLVASGNDAAITLAEALGPSQAFIAEMNAQARRLGMTRTHFGNTSGLPVPGQYSTALDLALLARRLWLDFPERRPLYAELDYVRAGFQQKNRNQLLQLDRRVDGMKTGHTATAGYHLIFTAQGPEGKRVLGVLLGAPSEPIRTREGLRLLALAFPVAARPRPSGPERGCARRVPGTAPRHPGGSRKKG